MKTSLRTFTALGSASGSVLVLAGFIALWWAASTSGWVNRAFLPTPAATAAIRDAEDGPSFAGRVQAETGLVLRVLSGQEEAKYAALGVLAGAPAGDGG